MYYLSPRNKYVLVEHLSERATLNRAFVLPTSYKEDTLHHKVMRVIEDSTGNYEPECLILVPTHSIETIEIDKQKYFIVPENHIIALVTEMENKI